MSSDNEVLERVNADRRGFVKKIIIGTTFAAPVMASFSMDGLSIKVGRSAYAGNTTNSF